MGRPKKNKEQSVEKKIAEDVIEEMKNVSLMTEEEVAEMKVEGRAVPPKKEEVIEPIDTIEEEIIDKEENNDSINDEHIEENEDIEEVRLDTEIDIKETIDTDETVQEIVKEETVEVKKEKPKFKRRTTRDTYGYDWCGLCYDE